MKYTREQVSFLRTGFQTMTVIELTEAFNARFGLQQTRIAIHCTLGRENIRRGRRILIGKRLTYTGEQIDFLKTNYRRLPLAKLPDAFNEHFGTHKTKVQIRAFLKNHGITSGRTGRFIKGQKSWNKGVKGYMGPNATSFKKGNRPKNWKPLGTERISKDGYIEIKVAERNPYTGFPTRYRLKHQVVWESVNGPIPAGKIVIFRDGDRTNCAIGNLVCISRAVGVRLNQFGYTGLQADLKPSMLALARLKAKTFERLKSSRRENLESKYV
jgi:hypothetical protein